MDIVKAKIDLIKSFGMKLYDIIRNGIFHVTTVKNFHFIFDDGYIKRSGTVSPQWAGKAIAKSNTCYDRKTVCIFDFNSATDFEFFDQKDNWYSLLFSGVEQTVIFSFSRETLESFLIPYTKEFCDGVPYVEAQYSKDISIEMIDSVIIIPLHVKSEFLRVFKSNTFYEESIKAICKVQEIENDYRKKYPEKFYYKDAMREAERLWKTETLKEIHKKLFPKDFQSKEMKFFKRE